MGQAAVGQVKITWQCLDETSARRGHNYITVFHDLDVGRLLFACEGRDADTVKTFAEDLRAHGGDPDAISAACIDMSRSYIAGVGRHLPNAAITFDRFHVIQLANAALEEVRRSEVREKPALKNSRWMWLKDKNSWTKRQIHQHHELSRMHLKTGRAFRLKETLRDIFMTTTTREEADEQLSSWFRWARRSKLAPFKRLALTLKAHWDGILNGFDSALSNGSVEAINGLIQAAKARARGYRKAPKPYPHGLPDRRQPQPPASLTLHHNIWCRARMTRFQAAHTNREIALFWVATICAVPLSKSFNCF